MFTCVYDRYMVKAISSSISECHNLYYNAEEVHDRRGCIVMFSSRNREQ